MENLTNQVLKLANKKNYFVLRQASYKGKTYYFTAEVTPDENDFTNQFVFLERIEVDGKFAVVEVKDKQILSVLAQNIKLD
ncbi:MAG: hypothetical protein PUA90_03325 [bacterium]|nr:hypothetical protein [bacterium]